MKKLLHSLLFAAVPIVASAQVTVSTSQYTADQLVNNVLLNNSCYSATNVSSKTGTDFASVNGIGYFQNNNSGFAFENGIILSNGDALNAPGPNTAVISGGSQTWLGDSDIDSFLNSGGPAYSSKNASVLEFDFTPLEDEISLNYIFASNEYGQFQCSWSDGVVFLLKDVTEGTNYSNIAVIPGTSTPITVSTIRSNANNSACPSVNSEFFGNYYAANPGIAPINFRGATLAMTAQSPVIPGHTYHLKIAIADNQDAVFDSAVFIEGGSLNIGAFGDLALLAQGDNICASEGVNLYVNLDEGFTYEWYKDGVILAGETQSTYTPLTAGEYLIVVTHGVTGCSETRSITVEAGSGLPVELNITDLIVADENNDGFAIFDLTAITTEIDNQTGQPEIYTVSYYETPDDAENGTNAIANTASYININPSQQTLYVLIYKTDSGCYDVFSFNLIVSTTPEAPTGAAEQTFTEGATLTDLEVEGENILWYDNSGDGPVPDNVNTPLPLSTLLIDDTTYYASQTIDGVESTQRLAVTVNLILGGEDLIFEGLRYYPNPVNSILNIENANGIDTVSIANALGQAVFSKAINSSSAQIDVSSLSKGVYFVTVASGATSKTIKIIKE